MKIVIDRDIPYINGVFEPFGEVSYLKGAEIKEVDVADADVMIIRTRTTCNASLLARSSVKMIATATIGTDHIDLNYCKLHKIEVATAAGSNARAVAQWVLAAIDAVGAVGTIGIVGVGNVGSEVEAMALASGFSILRCDPPRAERGDRGFVELDELLSRCDIVTLHVPLLPTTRSMIDTEFLSKMGDGALLLNSSRGEVSDEQAMLENKTIAYCIDVWQNEPHINPELLKRAKIATPHIAGYSSRGKARATQMVVNSVAEFLDIPTLMSWQPSGNFPLEVPETFDIMATDQRLRQSIDSFEAQRLIRI